MAGAAAALAGLIFVGMSLNTRRIISLPQLATRAFKALLVLLGALVFSSLLLTPQPTFEAGVEVLALESAFWISVTIFDARVRRRTPPEFRRRTAATAVGDGPRHCPTSSEEY